MGPRTFLELKEYIETTFNDIINECLLCQEVVIKVSSLLSSSDYILSNQLWSFNFFVRFCVVWMCYDQLIDLRVNVVPILVVQFECIIIVLWNGSKTKTINNVLHVKTHGYFLLSNKISIFRIKITTQTIEILMLMSLTNVENCTQTKLFIFVFSFIDSYWRYLSFWLESITQW